MKRAWLLGLAVIALWWAFRDSTPVVPDPPVVNPPFVTDRLTVVIIEDRLAENPIGIGADVYKWTKDNGVPFRVFHHEADMSQAEAVWQAAMGAPRDSLPWLYVVNGNRFYSGVPPKESAAFIALLEAHK